MNAELADLIDEAMNSEEEIDRTYLLEAVVADLRANTTAHVTALLVEPIS
jgi:hypothetical protein